MKSKKDYHPFRNLLTKVRLLLNADRRLTENQIKEHQWMLMTHVAEQKVLIGKGGINTMFYQFGDGKRKVCGPMDLVDLLKKLAKRKYVYYTVQDSVVWSEKTAKKLTPKKGDQIHGVLPNGNQIRLYEASPTISGQREWRPVKPKSKRSTSRSD